MGEFSQPWDSTDDFSGPVFVLFGRAWYMTSQPPGPKEENEEYQERQSSNG